MAKPPKTNPVQLRPDMTIGTGIAETDDEFLFDCFVHHPSVGLAMRHQSPGMILAGRTGSGKTAILRYIERQEAYRTELDPEQMSMSYVANSDAMQFLDSMGADLDLLFQVLWKHVICIEFIRMRWAVNNEAKSRNVFSNWFRNLNRDARKDRAIAYLKAWEGKFWITMDQNIKEITEDIENKIRAEFAAELEQFKIGGGAERRISSQKRTEIVNRTRSIISAEQLGELHSVIDMIAEQSNEEKYGCFILIDKLDENWVDVSIRFRLIRALISSLRSFRKIHNLKILVGLRADILERVVQESDDITFQTEKFEDLYIRIRWSKAQLKEVIEKRIGELFRRQYTSKSVAFDDVFTHKLRNKDPFDAIVERTLMRPRDVIAFVNECIEAADGQYEIHPKHFDKAEAEYSRKRRVAIEQEWRSVFPNIAGCLRFVAGFRQASVTVQEMIESQSVDDLALDIHASGKIDFDPIFDSAVAFTENGSKAKLQFLQQVLASLYRTGAIGIKLKPEERFYYAHLDDPVLLPEVIDLDVKVRVHPMLHGAFKLDDESRRRLPSSIAQHRY